MRSEIDAILEAGEMMLNPPDDLAEFIDKPAVKKSRTDQLISLFRRTVEGTESPIGVPKTGCSGDARFSYEYLRGEQQKAVENFRQAVFQKVGE